MKRYDFNIPIYDVDVTLLQVERGTESECRSLRKVLRSFGCKKECIDEDIREIRDGDMNGGATYRNMTARVVVVVFHEFTSEERMVEVYSHEKRHVEDRILEFFEVNDTESAGLLAGFLGVEFHKFYKMCKKEK